MLVVFEEELRRYRQDDVVGPTLQVAQSEVLGEIEDPIVEGHVDLLKAVIYT